MEYVHNGDATVFLESLPSASVDCVLTDPPYCNGGFMKSQKNRSTSKKIQYSTTNDKKPDFYGDCKDQKSMEKWCIYWMKECWRVLKPGGMFMCFMDWRNLSVVIDSMQIAGLAYRGIYCWNKPGTRPQKGIFRNDTEFVVYGTRGDVVQMDKYAKGYCECSPVATPKRIHGTEKPVKILENLLYFVPEGGVVVDPFAGSGAVGEACHNMGLKFAGCELSEYYAQMSNERLEKLNHAD